MHLPLAELPQQTLWQAEKEMLSSVILVPGQWRERTGTQWTPIVEDCVLTIVGSNGLIGGQTVNDAERSEKQGQTDDGGNPECRQNVAHEILRGVALAISTLVFPTARGCVCATDWPRIIAGRILRGNF